MRRFASIASGVFATWIFVVAVILLLSGCAHVPAPPPEPRVVVKEVKVAVAVRCAALEELGPMEPSYSDTDGALAGAANIFERVKLLLQGRVQRDARLARYVAAKGSC